MWIFIRIPTRRFQPVKPTPPRWRNPGKNETPVAPCHWSWTEEKSHKSYRHPTKSSLGDGKCWNTEPFKEKRPPKWTAAWWPWKNHPHLEFGKKWKSSDFQTFTTLGFMLIFGSCTKLSENRGHYITHFGGICPNNSALFGFNLMTPVKRGLGLLCLAYPDALWDWNILSAFWLIIYGKCR